jgi:hypothetical protein
MNCVHHPQTTATAYCRTCGKALCESCQRPVKGIIYCEECLAARVEGAPSAPSVPVVPVVPPEHGPNPAVAGILSGFLPFGTGVMYCGEFMRALVHAGVFFGLIGFENVVNSDALHAVLGMGIAFWYFFMIFDSVRVAKAKQTGQPVPDLFGLGVVSQPQTGQPGAAAVPCRRTPVGPIVLIGLGVLFLLHSWDLLDFDWDRVWQFILIAVGIFLIFRNRQRAAGYAPGCCPPYYAGSGIYRAPVILFTVAAMGLLDSYTRFGWDRSWPLLLIVIGALSLLRMQSGNQSNWGAPGNGSVPPAGDAGATSSEVSHG